MNKPEIIVDAEVLSELEFRALHANEHYRNSVRSFVTGIEEAIASGDHLEAAKSEFSATEIADGKWGKWLDKNFEGSQRTANKYMRLARNKRSLPRRDDAPPLSIANALQMLAAPKEEKDEEDKPKSQAPEPEKPQKDTDTKLAEAEKKLKEQRKKASDAQAKAQELKEEVEAERARRVEEVSALSREMRENLQEQLADVYARYGIEESPSIFEVNDKHWQKALEKTRNHREEEALKHLSALFPLISKMRRYEPDEGARAFLRWPSPERSEEAVNEAATWLKCCAKEMEAMTTKGTLRLLERKSR